MMDPDAGTGSTPDQQRHLRRLVSSMRARGGIGAVAGSCHRDVPGVDGVVLAVLAAHAGRIIVSDSGRSGDLVEDLHLTLGEGPGLDAAATGSPVPVADLDTSHAHLGWPRFAAQSLTHGLRAVFAYPVRLHGRPVGVLSLYRASPGPLGADAHEQIVRHTEAATVLLLDGTQVDDAGDVHIPLPIRAAEVQQAVGIVMELATVDAATALHRIRVHARRSDRPMREVVAEVRALRLPFDPTDPT
jgi:hypothetical protein